MSKTFSVKLPADDHDSLRQMMEDTVNRPAFDGVKYARFAAVEIGLSLLHNLEEGVLKALVSDYRGEL